MRHKCHAKGCLEMLPTYLLMCKRHWFMVPPDLQKKLYAAWSPVQKGTATVEQVRRHREVKVECILAVNAKIAALRGLPV